MIGGGWNSFNPFSVFQAITSFIGEIGKAPVVDHASFTRIWAELGKQVEREIEDAARHNITDTPTAAAAAVADRVDSARSSLSSSTTELADVAVDNPVAQSVRHELEDLEAEINALADLADRALDEAAGDHPFSDSQLKTLRGFFGSALAKCEETKDKAAKLSLTNEFFATYRLEELLHGMLDQLRVLERAEKPSIKEQMALLFEKLEAYQAVSVKGLGTAGVIERRLKEIEAMLSKAIAASSENIAPEQQDDLVKALFVINEIKRELSDLDAGLQEVTRFFGPFVTEQVSHQIDARLEEVEALRQRSETLHYGPDMREKHMEPAFAFLHQKTSDYAKAVIGLLERQEQVLDDAIELKKIRNEYDVLNASFSKELDQAGAMIQEIRDKKEAAERVAESKARFKERGFVPSEPKASQKVVKRAPAPVRSEEISQVRSPTTTERKRMAPMMEELEGRLKKRTGAKLGGSVISDEELATFRKQVAESTKARKAKLAELKQNRK